MKRYRGSTRFVEHRLNVKNVSLKSALVAPTAFCLVGILVLSGISALNGLQRYRTLQEAERITPLLHSAIVMAAWAAPGEGVASAVFSATGSEEARRNLEPARAAFDEAFSALRSSAAAVPLSDRDAAADVAFLLDRLGSISQLRPRVDARQVTAKDIVDVLQPTAPRAFDLIQRVGLMTGDADISHAIEGLHALLQFTDGTQRVGLMTGDADISHAIEGLHALLQFTDGTHIEDGALLQGLSKGGLSDTDRTSLTDGQAIQQLFAPTVVAAAPADISQTFRDFTNGAVSEAVGRLRDGVERLAAKGSFTSDSTPPEALLQKRGAVLADLIGRYERDVAKLIHDGNARAWSSLLICILFSRGNYPRGLRSASSEGVRRGATRTCCR